MPLEAKYMLQLFFFWLNTNGWSGHVTSTIQTDTTCWGLKLRLSLSLRNEDKNHIGPDHQYADRPSMWKFDKQTPFMEKQKRKNIFQIIVIFLSLPWMFLPNFKQIQLNLTLHHILFLHQLCIHSIFDLKNQNYQLPTQTLLKLAPRATDFRVLAPATIFEQLANFYECTFFLFSFF